MEGRRHNVVTIYRNAELRDCDYFYCTLAVLQAPKKGLLWFALIYYLHRCVEGRWGS